MTFPFDIDAVIFQIPKGCNLVAVGKRSVTHGIEPAVSPTPERVEPPKFDPFRVRTFFFRPTVGVAQRSPTAIKLDPFGIQNKNAEKVTTLIRVPVRCFSDSCSCRLLLLLLSLSPTSRLSAVS